MAHDFLAFEGQVTFSVTYQSLESFIVAEAIDNAIPEAADYPEASQLRVIYRTFRFYLSSTEAIKFKLADDPDADLVDFKAFWKFAQNNTDYAAIWQRYRKAVNAHIEDAWRDAIGSAIPARLLAPSEVWPDAPDDSEEPDPNELAPANAT